MTKAYEHQSVGSLCEVPPGVSALSSKVQVAYFYSVISCPDSCGVENTVVIHLLHSTLSDQHSFGSLKTCVLTLHGISYSKRWFLECGDECMGLSDEPPDDDSDVVGEESEDELGRMSVIGDDGDDARC
ncbi:hypothetical protein Tco_0678898 [Tanacetum coccineum]|uniref:Uncharacterized protein n=1 Tax=Tanacetum coccineum TaxID=301880 RepID=A0ABQ4XGJ6_9ASTR